MFFRKQQLKPWKDFRNPTKNLAHVVPLSTPNPFPPSFSTTDSFYHADIIGLWVHHHANLGQKNPRDDQPMELNSGWK